MLFFITTIAILHTGVVLLICERKVIMNRKIGKLIQERRELLGLSLEDVAKEVGVVRTSIFRWEHGETRTIRSSHIQKLSIVLGLSIEELLGIKEPKGDPEIIKYRQSIRKELRKINDIAILKQIETIVKTFTEQ
jgi:transcriptional regulator with XRE-family HTH domain